MDTTNLEQYQSLLTLCEQLKRAKNRVFVITEQIRNSSHVADEQMRDMYIQLGKAHMDLERVTELVVSHT